MRILPFFISGELSVGAISGIVLVCAAVVCVIVVVVCVVRRCEFSQVTSVKKQNDFKFYFEH